MNSSVKISFFSVHYILMIFPFLCFSLCHCLELFSLSEINEHIIFSTTRFADSSHRWNDPTNAVHSFNEQTMSLHDARLDRQISCLERIRPHSCILAVQVCSYESNESARVFILDDHFCLFIYRRWTRKTKNKHDRLLLIGSSSSFLYSGV